MNHAGQGWDVFLRGKLIDTVFYDVDVSADEVRRSLINHDNYNPNIVVRRSKRSNPSGWTCKHWVRDDETDTNRNPKRPPKDIVDLNQLAKIIGVESPDSWADRLESEEEMDELAGQYANAVLRVAENILEQV